MKDSNQLTNQLVEDLKKVGQLAGVDIPYDSITWDKDEKKAHSASFPLGKMAVYVFFWGDKCLKVGKVGPKSGARYTNTSQRSHLLNPRLCEDSLKNNKILEIEYTS